MTDPTPQTDIAGLVEELERAATPSKTGVLPSRKLYGRAATALSTQADEIARLTRERDEAKARVDGLLQDYQGIVSHARFLAADRIEYRATINQSAFAFAILAACAEETRRNHTTDLAEECGRTYAAEVLAETLKGRVGAISERERDLMRALAFYRDNWSETIGETYVPGGRLRGDGGNHARRALVAFGLAVVKERALHSPEPGQPDVGEAP